MYRMTVSDRRAHAHRPNGYPFALQRPGTAACFRAARQRPRRSARQAPDSLR